MCESKKDAHFVSLIREFVLWRGLAHPSRLALGLQVVLVSPNP